ncbi:serine hydrolase domain-containing protein [Marinicella sp. W31]|uniref:serine hydrolase domain-containing protein n=1 Tax=Marinicella sp. W31 TaxID=3023713 RepID=UPI0037580D0B
MRFNRMLLIASVVFFSACAQVKNCAPGNLQCALTPLEEDEFDDLHSVVVMQNGDVLLEQYYNGGDQDTRVDVRSAGKSVTALLMGIALDQKVVKSLDDSVSEYWAESEGTAVGSVRLDDLLTMRSGLDADANNSESFGYEDFMDASDNPKAFALTVPNLVEPGTLYSYNSLAAYITGIVIGEAADQEFGEFARIHLFEPLKITNLDWQKDRSGITKGQGNLFITAQGFARLGQLVLDGGTFEGRQIVSANWIKEILKPIVDISQSDSNAIAYSYYWYQQIYNINNRQIEVWFASGNGGNKIYLVPELDMVVSVMSDAYGQGRSHRRSENILLTVLEQKTR